MFTFFQVNWIATISKFLIFLHGRLKKWNHLQNINQPRKAPQLIEKVITITPKKDERLARISNLSKQAQELKELRKLGCRSIRGRRGRKSFLCFRQRDVLAEQENENTWTGSGWNSNRFHRNCRSWDLGSLQLGEIWQNRSEHTLAAL